MSMQQFCRGRIRALAVSLLLILGIGRTARADSAPLAVEALLYSTMPSTAAHRPEMAMDGNAGTYFRSAYGMGGQDIFLVMFSQAIAVQRIRITTGDADGQDILTEGGVETSEDGATFQSAATFDAAGVASAALAGKPVRLLRVRLGGRRSAPALLIREITVETSAKITHVQIGPGRGFADLSAAPELKVWADKAEQQMESFWGDAAAILYSDGFITPNMVSVVYRTGPDVTPVAATGGGVMTVNTAWCRSHPEDTGLTVHEMAHVVQAMSAYNPVWLIEGVADYIRWIKFEPENYRVRINPNTATYHDSYRTTATFLAWCELHYDNRLVTHLNHDVRFGHYSNARFKQYCGKDVDALWTEFVAAYRADPAHIITAPVAPADQPRSLPAISAGSSAPVDLTGIFNAIGLARDGETLQGSPGFDGEGSAYASALLGTTLTVKDVVFHIGPANRPDVITCTGQVITLPAGLYGSVWLLGAAVEGSQMAQQIVITYTDGSTEKLAQNFSDWYVPRRFPGEMSALRMAYRIAAGIGKDTRPFYVYEYGFRLNAARTIRSLTLPNNPNVKILAISLAR